MSRLALIANFKYLQAAYAILLAFFPACAGAVNFFRGDPRDLEAWARGRFQLRLVTCSTLVPIDGLLAVTSGNILPKFG